MEDPNDQSAWMVVDAAETSVLREATRGRLAAVAVLMETYASLVVQVSEGEQRLQRLERRTADVLVTWGDDRRQSDLSAATTAWTLAAKFDPDGGAIERLRQILLPPDNPEEGQKWTSVIDGAEFVYQPPERIRLGCTTDDRRCRNNEIYFRWIDVEGFWIESTEVTNQRYRICIDFGRCSPPADVVGSEDEMQAQHPVVGVTWKQARDFARWAGRRLPTEAQWERAARGQATRWRFPWGNGRRTEFANVWEESNPGGRGRLPVGTFAATGLGLNDVAGNVWEWCGDRYRVGFKNLPNDGRPMQSGAGRVVRGGSWRRGIDLARVSARSWFEEDYQADDLGFRCVVEPASEISDSKVRSLAERIFALRVPPGSELIGVELSSEDRRYLERRALTWLRLEERAGEAALLAAIILHRDPRDTVALDLLDWVEDQIVDEALAGRVAAMEELRSRYLSAVARSPRHERRIRVTDERIVEALRQCGESMARNGDRRRAEECLDSGLKIAPIDQSLRRARQSVEPVAGETRISPIDERVMVWVPSGEFRFGASFNDRQLSVDELPAGQRTVRGFWLDRHEVTNKQYRRCVDDGACTPPGKTDAYDDPNRSTHPVLWVTWYQARDYAAWAGKRLPSEVEWERAARADRKSRYPWGDEWQAGFANAFDVGEGDRWGAEAPVGRYPANSWGIHDLVGNAAEWVQDVYHTSYAGGPLDDTPWEQETGPSAERRRVIRGGSHFDPPVRQRVSRRAARRPTEFHRTVGFRCASD
jgi:formylglycine-generating enzyme required for sulfatase activity